MKAHQRAVANDARLHALHQPGAQFAIGQRAQHADIGKHRQRMMKAADQVLALGQIHAGLAAHRRVHLREERRRHLHVGNAAHEDRGHESAHIAHDAAAERNQQRPAIAARRDHLPQQLLHAGHGLVLFSRREKKRNRRLGKRGGEGLAPQRPDLRRGHHENAPAAARPAIRSIRGASVAMSPLPAMTSYLADGVSTRMVCTLLLS